MASFVDDVIFPLIPVFASIALSFILAYWYLKDRNQRKLMFAIGILLAAFGFLFSSGLVDVQRITSSQWLFMPISLAACIAVVASLRRLEKLEKHLLLFWFICPISIALFLGNVEIPLMNFALLLLSMLISIPTLVYLVIKTKDIATLHFLLATLCFMVQGITITRGSPEEIPVLLSTFGNVFVALMFITPNVSKSSPVSFLKLEEQLNQAHQDLKTAKSKLLKSERLAAIGELAGIVGHDLRNPLQGISMSTYYLQKHQAQKLDEKGKQSLKNIEDCIKRSNKIVNDLLEYSREIRLDLEELTPKDLVEGAMRQIQKPHFITIENQTQNKPFFRVDRARMERVFINLISNAIDATHAGGTLTITAEPKNKGIVFCFADTGEGMSSEVLTKIWTPLFTTKAVGMGFGLAICKRYVEAHGGQISVESREKKGSVFFVTLPIEPKSTDIGQRNYASSDEIGQIWKSG